MPIRDLLSIDRDETFDADVCIVGSGPAAWTIAKELADTNIRVLVLESGGGRLEDGATELNDTEDVGMPLFNGRCRIFGGSTESPGWGNRCIAFDAIDYERRDWVPQSGWPFDEREVAPYLDRASRYLGAGPFTPDPIGNRIGGPITKPAIDERLLRNIYWVFGRDRDWMVTRFSSLFRAHRGQNIDVLLHATVTHLNLDFGGDRIASVEIAYPDGERKTISAPIVVLCAGGIENPRLLLASNRQAENGIGNGHDLVGRYLMDHPRDLNMTIMFDPGDVLRINKFLGPARYDSGDGPRLFTGGFALSDQVQREEGLLNAAAWPMEDMAEHDPTEAIKRLARRDGSNVRADVGKVVRRPDYLLRGIHSRLIRDQPVRRLPSKVGFFIGSEQTPDPDSRVSLSERRDRFGQPIARTCWRISYQDRASQGRLATLIASEFERLRLPKGTLAPWVLDKAYADTVLQDGCHPTGTTRMSADPRGGVVNVDSQVHGVRGLYVAGSSVFPTASHANPTLMIVAMATRLAAHLRTQFEGISHMSETRAHSSFTTDDGDEWPARVPAGTRVAVTGANGFIGGRLVERLVEQGAVVTCLNRGRSNARVQRTGAGATQVELADVAATTTALRGIQIVFHCAYDWDDEAWNVTALRSLIAASRANACERFVHISSFVVYQLPSYGEVTEETEDTTACSGYSFVKRQMELELLEANRIDGFPCAILQPTIVYGPGSKPWTIEPTEMMRFGIVILPDEAEGICAAVYVDDVVDAMLIAAINPAAIGQRFLVSGPEPVTWRAFYETLARAAGVNPPKYLPIAQIEQANTKAAKLRRFLLSPERVVRRAAQVGPLRRAVTTVLKALPGKMGEGAKDALYGSGTRRRGFVHMPDVGRARWMSGHSTIHSGKARRSIGYRPRFGLAEGMAATAPSVTGQGNGN